MMKLILLVALAIALTSAAAAAPSNEQAGNAKSPQTDGPAVAKANNEFGLDLFGQLRTEEGNIFFSPYSISTALTMTYAGARTQTAEEMAKTLHLALQGDRLHAANAAMHNALSSPDKKRPYQLNIANSLWGQKGYGFLPEFLNLTGKFYGAGFNEVDFVRDTEAARKLINDWVEKQTKEKIKELIKKNVVTANTVLVLTNAIYFKGDWQRTFDKKQTFDQAFHLSALDMAKVPMMNQTAAFRYHAEPNLQVLELPYSGKDLSMVILLPKEVDGLPTLEKSLTEERLQQLLGALKEDKVMVALPKFKMTCEFSLGDALIKLGMKSAFNAGSADFSGMNGSAGRLFISKVIHKAFVEVNEEGTEAAAATAVIVDRKSAGPPQPVFRADHPFVFVIRDNHTGAVLFMGRVADPR